MSWQCFPFNTAHRKMKAPSVSPGHQQSLTVGELPLASHVIVLHLGGVCVPQAPLLEPADELLQRYRAVPVHVQAVEDPKGLLGRDLELLTDGEKLVLLDAARIVHIVGVKEGAQPPLLLLAYLRRCHCFGSEVLELLELKRNPLK